MLLESYWDYFSRLEDTELVCKFESVEEFEARAATVLQPDILIVDIELSGRPCLEGIGVIKKLFPGTKVMMLSVSSAGRDVFHSLRAGADGYVVKTKLIPDVDVAIKDLVQKGSFLSRDLITELIQEIRKKPESAIELKLTKRELEVVSHLRKGLSYKAIAAELFITPYAVNQHLKHIYRKLGVASRNELVAVMYNDPDPC